jgi:hypothetical protein
MPVTDGQLFVVDAGDGVTAADLVEIQAGTSPFSVGGTTSAIQRPLIRSFIDRQVAAPAFTKHWAVTVTTELKGTAAAPDGSTYPEIFRLLRASGLEQTLVGGNTWEYTWLADPSSTTDAYECDVFFQELIDGNEYTAADANFSFTMQGSADAVATATFTGMGSYDAPAVVAALEAATANGGSPLLPITSYDVGGKTTGLVIRDWSVSSGLTLTPRVDLSDADGYAFPAMVSRDAAVQVTLNIEAVDTSVFDAFGKYADGDSIDISWTIGDGTRHIAFEAINVMIDAPTLSQGTPNMFGITGAAACASTGADSSLQITYS